MEQYELKPLILSLLLDALEAFPDPRWQAAIALQAYLPETGDDLVQLLEAAQRRGRKLGVRLVKGAYWDQEQAWSAQRGWPVPTYTDKGATDAAFEGLTAWLLAHADSLYPAIGAHNLRSQAVAIAHARQRGLAATDWEAQVLHGMAEPLRDALVAEGVAVRVYLPTGDLLPGIAYLMRRLLENSAASSVLRQTYLDGVAAEHWLAPPRPAPATAADVGTPEFANLPLLDFSRAGERQGFAAALGNIRAHLPRLAPGTAGSLHQTRNPAAPDEILGETALVTPAAVRALVAGAAEAQPDWAARPVAERTAILRRAADAMSGQRYRLAALAVLEVAKNWREADADVAEAIDFLRYYSDQMDGLAGWRTTRRFPGEDNRGALFARGVAAVIAPWNFPYALLGGMTGAALVTGNAAVLKPALPALLSARAYRELLVEAGVPGALIPLAPGDATVGAALVADPGIEVVAFTGSRAVGLEILRCAHTPWPGQRHVRQVVCEMGGKNAIIVDADADLDEAVTGILASAFGYAGQKCSACSRLIAVGDIHDRLLARLAEAAAALAWGPPEDPAYAHGPVITASARDKALAYVEIGKGEGRLAWQGTVPAHGWYVPPSIFADIRPEHRLAREEIFAPVLAVLRAPDFATALALANDSDYGLTGGVYSRLPQHLSQAESEFGVGNLYLNRRITGARVGAQPFGGVRLSGTGPQAGGPDYLRPFLAARTVSSNTMRHGYIPNEFTDRGSNA
jgi:RHH-type proline utilization regulon transcriptional repressor/proline dehydrogenase/delta 1-pyrroline-5-carboxylate dehydrogenase